jgi:hypothetical protein
LGILIEEGDGRLSGNSCQVLQEQGNTVDVSHVLRKGKLPERTGSTFTVEPLQVERELPQMQRGNTNV